MTAKRTPAASERTDDRDSSLNAGGIPVSVRLREHQLRWATAQGEERGLSVGGVTRELINDAITWYELPTEAAELLEADRKARGQDRREYVKNLLNRRYTELVIARSGKERPPTSK